MFSPHDPDVLYVTGEYVFRSDNGGESWEIISPDLTRGDESKMEASGGPLTLDTTMVEHYGTVFAFAESQHEKGVFWVGSDDGLVHISRDGGDSWDDVTPSAIPEWTRIDIIEVSPHDPATAYISATRYKWGRHAAVPVQDERTTGRRGRRSRTAFPEDDFTRVIREDPVKRGLLYAGTETRVYVSFDDGGSWQTLRGNMPITPISDLVVKGDDLVVATNGRSFWILDDLPALRQLTGADAESEAVLLQPGPALRDPHPVGGRQAGRARARTTCSGSVTAGPSTRRRVRTARLSGLCWTAARTRPAGSWCTTTSSRSRRRRR